MGFFLTETPWTVFTEWVHILNCPTLLFKKSRKGSFKAHPKKLTFYIPHKAFGMLNFTLGDDQHPQNSVWNSSQMQRFTPDAFCHSALLNNHIVQKTVWNLEQPRLQHVRTPSWTRKTGRRSLTHTESSFSNWCKSVAGTAQEAQSDRKMFFPPSALQLHFIVPS